MDLVVCGESGWTWSARSTTWASGRPRDA